MKQLAILFIFFTASAVSQNTEAFDPDVVAPKATLEDAAWIAGHWKGEALGGTAEEIWSPPLGGSMMFVFKLVVDKKVSFYEIGHIKESGETLLLQLKHFYGSLEGWEEKDETVDFKLVRVEKDRLYFDGFTFERIGPDELNLYVVIEQEEGREQEVKFNYKRQD